MLFNRFINLTLLTTLLSLYTNSVLAAGNNEWKFGIGTGIKRLNAEGDVGFTSFRGAEKAKLDLEPDDFQDLMDTAYGFSGFANRGPWQIQFSYGYLRLKDSGRIELAGGALPPLHATFEQDITAGRVAAVYQFAETAGHHWGVLAGLNYTKHDYDVDISYQNTTRNKKLRTTGPIFSSVSPMPIR